MSASAARRAADILAALDVPRNELIYVQVSLDWIERAGLNGTQTLADLIEWVSPRGTLVLPTYPFHSTHRAYLESNPAFDVRRTPSSIGLLPEMFRRTKGTVRSLDPDFCVSALGPDAAAIVGTSPATDDPFGADSAYQRMLDRGCTLVGLGVSLNTSSFIHVIDSRMQAVYPSAVYESQQYSASVVDASGGTHRLLRKALRPAFQRLIKPSAINAVMRPADAVFRTIEIDTARFFKWTLAPWAAWCESHARERASASEWPCWLADVGASLDRDAS